MSRKRIYIIIGLLIITVLLAVIIRPGHTTTPTDQTEPEGDILNTVTFSGDAKLNALLPAPQVSATKQELTTYIHARYGKNIHRATIESTTLQNDGEVALTTETGSGKTFSATIESDQNQFIFRVAATNYQTSTPQSVIANQYGVSTD